MMGWFKQLCLSWIILSAAALCVSCQELTSALREGNLTCPGEEVIFNCTVRGPSSLSNLVLAWSSDEYILGSLQLSTAHGSEDIETSSMNGVITATARVTNTANVAGELILESSLRITAVKASTVTCMSGADGGTASIEFFISAVPGVPQRIDAAEISRPRDNICIILVTWNPPANSDPSDIDQYIIYVASRNISDISSLTISTLTLSNCDNDIHVQVAAVNRVGCVGMNSSEVQLDNIIIPTVPTDEGATTTTTEGGSAPTSSRLGAGPIAGIIIAVVLVVAGIGILSGIGIYKHFIKEQKGEGSSRIPADHGYGVEFRANEEEQHNIAVVRLGLMKHEWLKELHGSLSPMECLIDLYISLKTPSQTSGVNGTLDETSDRDIASAVGALRAALKKTEASDITDQVMTTLVILKDKKPDEMRGALDYLMKIIPDSMSNEVKSNLQELRDNLKASETTLLENALNSMIVKVLSTPPDKIKKILLRLCDTLFEKLLKLSPEQETALKKFNIPFDYFKSLTAKDLESVEEDVQVKMHVYEMPKRTEKGEFLVVDMLDVDHLQVRHINVIEGRIEKINCEEFKRDETAADETANGLVYFINDCITKFIKKKNIEKNRPITFTPPFHDTSGKLIRWIKEPEGAPEEIKNMEVDVAAAVNDATGILLAMGNTEPDCRIGLSFRDRANACYMEELVAGDCKVINMDWGAFDDDGKLEQWRTDSDGQLDDNPQLFEKMISEEQQGVVVCRALKDLHCNNKLFVGQRSRVTKLNFDEVEAFCKGNLGIIEGWDIEMCKRQLKRRFEIEASDRDCVVIQRVCEAVSTRAAKLAAAGIVAIVKKINKMDGCTVAVDSFLYIQHPQFLKRIQVALKELEPGNNIKIKPVDYGSHQSAEFAAAMLKYCVGPPPSSSPGSSEGSEGQRGQQEDIRVQSDAAEEHAAAKNLISANVEVEVYPQPAGENIELPDVKS